MAKYELRIKAREMRSNGKSVRDISKELHISKSTASLWVRDIILSVEQLEKLQKRKIIGGELGRLKGSLMQKERRLSVIENFKREGVNRLKDLSDSQFFVAGIALYWAEGSKKSNEFSFCNSDPNLIKFMLVWLNKFFDVDNDRLTATVGINEMHKKREWKVKNYWINITGIPPENFRRTSFKKAKVHKVYANFNDHYGTLVIKALKGSTLCYKILGLIKGLSITPT